MDFKEKIDMICKEKSLTQKELAEILGINHIVFNRNLGNNKISSDMIIGFTKNMADVDLNWLLKDKEFYAVNESKETYLKGENKKDKIQQAIKILQEVSEQL